MTLVGPFTLGVSLGDEQPPKSRSTDPQTKRLCGELSIDDFVIRAGEVVEVPDDLRIQASGNVLIEGEIVALGRGMSDHLLQGPNIEISAGGWLVVNGHIRALLSV